MRYNKKMIITKNRVRIIESSRPLEIGYEIREKRDNFQKALDGQKSKYSYSRAQDNLVLTIDSNVTNYSKFITLTFEKSELDYKQAMSKFNRFGQFFKRKFNKKLAYTRVAERQRKRGLKEGNQGSWHFHLIIYLDDYLDFKQLKSCWPYGSLDLKAVDDPKNLGRYMGKYLSKQKSDIEFHKQLVSHSRGLARPTITYELNDTPFDSWKPIFSKRYDYMYEKDIASYIQFELREYDISNS